MLFHVRLDSKYPCFNIYKSNSRLSMESDQRGSLALLVKDHLLSRMIRVLINPFSLVLAGSIYSNFNLHLRKNITASQVPNNTFNQQSSSSPQLHDQLFLSSHPLPLISPSSHSSPLPAAPLSPPSTCFTSLTL